ncbi:EAL domain-containing protein [Alsobacter sp. KACC 23698]|uniref:EAL domain-containing protein n=1 Tax=Alsobacter sp. KACC 23698 TaxID=3149229 RepID=A0AAU7JHB1_9HYPH
MKDRLEPLAIFGAVVAVSLAVAVTAWAGLGVAWPYAALAGMASSVALLMAAAQWRRGGALDAQARAKVEALEAQLAQLREEFAGMGDRLAVLDTAMVEYSRKTVNAVASELDLVGSVVRDLAQTVAMHDAELFAKADPPRPQAPVPVRAEASQRAQASAWADASPAPEPAAWAPADPPAFATPDAREPERPAGLSAGDAALVARAIMQDGVELQLQPIVALPSRKVSLYEAHLRVRLADGRAVAAPQVMDLMRRPAADLAALGLTQAEQRELAGRLDAFLLATIAKIARHLLGRNRDAPILCALSPQALVDPQVYRALKELKWTEPDLVGRLLFQLGVHDMPAPGALDGEGLDAIRALGFRFAAHGLDHFGLDSRALFDRGFRYASAPAWLLIEAAEGSIATDIHPADLAGLMARHGLTLIVEDIDAESTMAELADFGVTLGKGELFGGPRPVRAEVLAGQPPEPAPAAAPAPAASPAPPTTARARIAAAASGPARAPAGSPAPLATGDRALTQAAARLGPTPSAAPGAPAARTPSAPPAAGNAIAAAPARRADGALAPTSPAAPPRPAASDVDEMRQSLRAFLTRSNGA